jgi:hypothetical protein
MPPAAALLEKTGSQARTSFVHSPAHPLFTAELHLGFLLEQAAVVLCCADVIDGEALVVLTQLLQTVIKLAATMTAAAAAAAAVMS